MIFLHNISLQVDSSFEKSFEQSMRKHMFKSHNWDEKDPAHKDVANPDIIERRLYIQVISPWRNSENIIGEDSILLRPDNSGICFEADKSLEIRNYIDHPLIGLNFRLEYRVNLKRQGHMSSDGFTVAYLQYLPDFENQ